MKICEQTRYNVLNWKNILTEEELNRIPQYIKYSIEDYKEELEREPEDFFEAYYTEVKLDLNYAICYENFDEELGNKLRRLLLYRGD